LLNTILEVTKIIRDENQRNGLLNALRENLIREVNFNLMIISEVRSLSARGKDKEIVMKLLSHIRHETFDDLLGNGVSLAAIVPGDWEISDIAPKQYRIWLENVQTKPELIERAWHRTEILRLCAIEGIYKNRRSWKYTVWLLKQARGTIKNSF
jgi:hypothetical protein